MNMCTNEPHPNVLLQIHDLQVPLFNLPERLPLLSHVNQDLQTGRQTVGGYLAGVFYHTHREEVYLLFCTTGLV